MQQRESLNIANKHFVEKYISLLISEQGKAKQINLVPANILGHRFRRKNLLGHKYPLSTLKNTVCISAGKTGFGRNGRQTKSSPGRGGFGASWGLLLAFDCHIGTRKCSKFVVKCEKIVVLRGFRGYFGVHSGSAMANK